MVSSSNFSPMVSAATAPSADDTGALESFDEHFERMVTWQARSQPEPSRADLEASTFDYMSTRPA